ncbi:MAG: hypothetical protein Q4F96_00675 [Bacillota bacterium]|nr:hypothetical protein [Bacillota bacterium]
MKPREPREHREQRRQAARRAGALDLGILKDRKLILLGLAAVALTLILLIVMTAYAASIKYEIGVTEAENSALWDDIKHLQSSQTTMNGVGYVEERAASELKMKAAKTEQIVYVSSSDMPPAGFADVLKSKAYQ